MVGVAKVVKAAYPDPNAEDQRFVAVDFTSVGPFGRQVIPAEIRVDERFSDWGRGA